LNPLPAVLKLDIVPDWGIETLVVEAPAVLGVALEVVLGVSLEVSLRVVLGDALGDALGVTLGANLVALTALAALAAVGRESLDMTSGEGTFGGLAAEEGELAREDER
jgi:hypothetical protein